ncbi:hypothetical protein ElyMa_005273200 [Elysia marginata]|uniref:Uncharacterized protein n=1 Tax=Elysia marginata TaxID=1093978 RepID=A0AAV4K2R3_9GAST|nr:hypothetical protein ElyMa_005273200 [Elysia marginata]
MTKTWREATEYVESIQILNNDDDDVDYPVTVLLLATLLRVDQGEVIQLGLLRTVLLTDIGLAAETLIGRDCELEFPNGLSLVVTMAPGRDGLTRDMRHDEI